MRIRGKYGIKQELSDHDLNEVYNQVRVKYKLMGVDLPESKIYRSKQNPKPKDHPKPKTKVVRRPPIIPTSFEIIGFTTQVVKEKTSGKHKRYRQKLISEGRCPKCGILSFPYHYCYKHRVVNNIHHALRRLVKYGVMRKLSHGVYELTGKPDNIVNYKVNDKSRSKLPRFGKRPADDTFFENAMVHVLTVLDRPLLESEMIAEIVKLKEKGLPIEKGV